MAEKRLHKKVRQFIDLYLTDAEFDAPRAAEMAGYKQPGTLGPRLVRRYREVIDARLLEMKDKAKMGPEEVQERLATVARDIRHKDHIRALELLSKIHGLSSEKLTVTTDKSSLVKELDDIVQRIAAVRSEQVQEKLVEDGIIAQHAAKALKDKDLAEA